METWYKVEYDRKIVTVEVDRFNDKSVWSNDRQWSYSGPDTWQIERHDRIANYEKYYPTFEEAKQYLVEFYQERVEFHKQQANDFNSTLGQVRKLIAPQQTVSV